MIVEGRHPGVEVAAQFPVHPALSTGGRAAVQLEPPSKGNNLLRQLVRQRGELGPKLVRVQSYDIGLGGQLEHRLGLVQLESRGMALCLDKVKRRESCLPNVLPPANFVRVRQAGSGLNLKHLQ